MDQLAALGEDGSLAEQLAEPLGITPDEEARIQLAYQTFLEKIKQEVQAHTFFTNVPPKEFGVGNRESLSRVRTAYLKKGEALKDYLQNSITGILGQERGNVAWDQVEGTINSRFNNFGNEDLIETVAREKNGWFRYWKGHRSPEPGSQWLMTMITEYSEKQVPEEFRPYLAKLKPADSK